MIDTSTVCDAKYCCNTFNVIYTWAMKTLRKLNIMFHMVEPVLWRDFGYSKDINGVLSTFFEKSIEADKELKKAQHYHFTGFFLSSLFLSLSSKTLNNCPNIQSSINHQQHILQIQNTVCLPFFKMQQKDRWILSSDRNFSKTEPSTKACLQKGLISKATQVDFFFF